ncbi:hypothetical protein P885DRAFT_71251 [Corynascus similis CBS 632.67]
MQMARCTDRADPQYRAIVGVLQRFIRRMALDGTKLQGGPSTTSKVKARMVETPGDSSREWRKAAIVGLGGVGKTQVALQLVYWTKKNRPEFSIFWVPALSNATFEQAFAAMAKQLPIQSGSDDDDFKESVRRYLSSEAAGPWLLVVDNADDKDILFGSADMPGGINAYLPESGDGLTLFTTRSREVAVSVTGSDEMVRDKAATAELLKQLTYLPLAITQAAAYINIKQVPVAEYLELLHGTQQNFVSLMSKEFRDNTRYPESQNAVATTWLVSFDQIRKSDNAAADLLSFISCIEPKGIPQSLFPRFESTQQLVDAIGTLCAYAFLTRRGDSKVFDMHNLVHLATRIWVQREGLTATASEKATRHLATVFPSDEYENRTIWREYLPHAVRALQYSKELDIEEKSDLLLWIGRCLIVDGRIREAVRSLEEACQWRSRHFAEDHPNRLASQHVLAMAYQDNGQVKEAITLLKHIVAIEARTLTEDHPDRLASQHELAMAYQDNGQHVVSIRERTLAEDHPNRLASQHVLARAYQANGEVKEAITLLEQIVAIEAKTLAEDHPDRLASQHALAKAYQANGQVKEGSNSVAILASLRNLQMDSADQYEIFEFV